MGSGKCKRARACTTAACLTHRAPVRNVNLMRRMIFAFIVGATSALVLAGPRAAAAQRVPGRDLLDFPLGTLAEAPALASSAGVALWNPAALPLEAGVRARIGVAALRSPADAGVGAQLAGVSFALPMRLAVGLSVAHADVAHLVRTDVDPTSRGEIAYSTTLVSLLGSRRTGEHLSTGLAVRYRRGSVDGLSRAALAADAGVLVDRLTNRDVRIAATTFLWQPGSGNEDRPAYSAATDVRVAGTRTRNELRAGYSATFTSAAAAEHYVHSSLHAGAVEMRIGGAYMVRFSEGAWRLRLAVGVRTRRHVVGLARDDAGVGLPATYQFSLSTALP